jgi:hypothetical protein
MERTEVLDMMSGLKLYGMRSAYDETLAMAIKRKHEPQRFVGDLLKAEIALDQVPAHRRQAAAGEGRRGLRLQGHADQRSSRARPGRRSLHHPAAQLIFIAGTGTSKTHLAIAIARSCIRSGSRGRFFTTVDLVNQLEAESRAGRQGRIADYLTRLDFVILDELGYLPFAQAGGQLLFHLVSRLYERTSIVVTTNLASASGRACSAIRR